MKPTQIYLPNDLRLFYKRLAAEWDVSMSEAIRRVLIEKMGEIQKEVGVKK